MSRPITAVMLAGRIRPSPLREALDVPVLCLPMGRRGSLLDAWRDALETLPCLNEVIVVVNTIADAEAIHNAVGPMTSIGEGLAPVRVIAEPAAWRGAGGLVGDVTSHLPDDAIVVVCESKRLPPCSLLPLVEPFLTQSEPAISGVVGVCGQDEPAGAYAFSRATLSLVPRVGYFDLKEQFLPAVCREGGRVAAAPLNGAVHRIRDLRSYLDAARMSMSVNAADVGRATVRIARRASVSGSAVIDGLCIVEHGAVIEDGAVVHDSVVLWGATIGGGAVVSGCIIGPLASVEPRSRVIRTVVTRQGEHAGHASEQPVGGGRLSW